MDNLVEDRIRKAREGIGEKKLHILSASFDRIESFPEGIGAVRFRADNEDWISELNELESIPSLVDRSRDQDDLYRIKPYALPLIDSDRAKRIVSTCEEILPGLKSLYRDRLGSAVAVEEILELSNEDQFVVLDAVYMMTELHGLIGGGQRGFPYLQGATTILFEDILQAESCLDVMTQYYDQHISDVPKTQLVIWPSDSYQLSRLPSIISACETDAGRLECVDFLDDAEKHILLEVDQALNAGLSALSVMGIRALFDCFVQKHVPNHRNFTSGLEALIESGIISARQAELIRPAFELGSATMHRGHIPSRDDVIDCINIYSHLVKAERDLRGRAEGVAVRTPPRPNKKKQGGI